MPRQAVHLRADSGRDASPDRSLSLQRVQIHEDEYARQSARLHEEPLASDRAPSRYSKARPIADRADARNLCSGLNDGVECLELAPAFISEASPSTSKAPASRSHSKRFA